MAEKEKHTMLVSYDLHDAESQDYNTLIEYIKGFGTWAHITESLWAIYTEKEEPEIRDEILDLVPSESPIFVSRTSGSASWGYVKCNNDWLKKYI